MWQFNKDRELINDASYVASVIIDEPDTDFSIPFKTVEERDETLREVCILLHKYGVKCEIQYTLFDAGVVLTKV